MTTDYLNSVAVDDVMEYVIVGKSQGRVYMSMKGRGTRKEREHREKDLNPKC
jgi:hypothetical protein